MNITFIGMPGSGKSVLGKELARVLGYKFLDVDIIMEEKRKLKLQQILEKLGDEAFIRFEEQTILGLGKLKNCIISPGGSVVYSAKAMQFLKEKSTVIFLDCPLQGLKNRLTNASTRGIVGLKNKGLEALFKERIALYRKYVDITIKVSDNFDIETVMKTTLHRLRKNCP
ncbi:MAG: shikimate kinase [Candidatus Woesearchaeota archaeon]